MRLAISAFIAVLATTTFPVSASQLCNGVAAESNSKVRPLCSATWLMEANCDGGDLLGQVEDQRAHQSARRVHQAL
jgi:hypothetical protein